MPLLPANGLVKKLKRDAICQTELTIPPILSKELEDLLRPFTTYTVDQQQSPCKLNCDTTIDYEARDASLRRKLFETSINTTSTSNSDVDRRIELDGLSPAPRSPSPVIILNFILFLFLRVLIRYYL